MDDKKLKCQFGSPGICYNECQNLPDCYNKKLVKDITYNDIVRSTEPLNWQRALNSSGHPLSLDSIRKMVEQTRKEIEESEK